MTRTRICRGCRSGSDRLVAYEIEPCTYIVENDIVGRDAVSRNEEECLVVDLEDLADFARGDLLETAFAEVDLRDGLGLRHVRCDCRDVVCCKNSSREYVGESMDVVGYFVVKSEVGKFGFFSTSRLHQHRQQHRKFISSRLATRSCECKILRYTCLSIFKCAEQIASRELCPDHDRNGLGDCLTGIM